MHLKDTLDVVILLLHKMSVNIHPVFLGSSSKKNSKILSHLWKLVFLLIQVSSSFTFFCNQRSCWDEIHQYFKLCYHSLCQLKVFQRKNSSTAQNCKSRAWRISIFSLLNFKMTKKIVLKTKSERYFFQENLKHVLYPVIIAQWLVRRLATGEVLGSNPGKGEN